MAKKKLTKAEKGRLLLNADWNDEELNDPLVVAARARLAKQQEQESADEEPRGRGGFVPQATNPETMSPLEWLGSNLSQGFDNLADSTIGGGKRSLGAGIYEGADSGNGQRAEALRGVFDQLNIENGGAIGALIQQLGDIQSGRGREDTQAFGERMFREGGSQVEGAYNRSQEQDGMLPKWLGGALNDAASSPSQLASLLGGPAAIVPGMDVYAQEYTQARLAGLSREEAAKRAGTQSGIETLIESIPAGKLGSKLLPGGIRDELMGDTARFLFRTGKTSLGEGAEEAFTTLAQLGADKALAETTDDNATKKFANANLPDDVVGLWDQTIRSGLAGAVGGHVASSPMEGMRIAAERGQAAAELLRQGKKATKERDVHNQKVDLEQPTANLFEGIEGPDPRDTNVEPVNVNPQIESFDVVRNLQREISNLEGRQAKALADPTKNTFTTDQANRLQSMKAALQRYGGSLGLDVPQQPANPVFDGQPKPAPYVPTGGLNPVEQQSLAGAPAPLPKSKTGKPKKTIKAEQDLEEQRQAMRVAFPDMSHEQIEASLNPGGVMTADQLRKKVGLSQNSGKTGKTSLEDVFGTLLKKVGSGDVRVLTKLMQDKNLKIVQDASQIPGETSADAKGYYDGNTTYIVASNLDRKNLVGDILSVAAHEGKHAADVSGKVTLGGFVGKEANEKLVSKIEALANKDPKVNQLVRALRQNIPDKGEYMLELPAYFINYAHDKRAKSFFVKRIANDIVSAVNTKTSEMLGIKDVDLNDVAYMSKKLLREVAHQGTQLTGDVQSAVDGAASGLQMILGEKATGFADADANGRTYTSADGRKKFIISDHEATIKNNGNLRALISQPNTSVYLPEILDHPKLFEQMPELKKTRVSVAELPGNTQGRFRPSINLIELDPKIANTTYIARGVLLHEIQHANQKLEGRDADFYDKEKGRDPEDKVEDANKYKAARMAVVDIIKEPLNIDWSREDQEALRTIRMNMELTTSERAEAIIDLADQYESAWDSKDRRKIERAKQAFDYLEHADKRRAEIESKDYDRYRENITEQEAFFTDRHSYDQNIELLGNPEAYFDHETIRDGTGKVLKGPKRSGLDLDLNILKQALEGNSESWAMNRLADLIGSLTSHGGLGKTIRNLKEKQRGYAAVFAHRAAGYARRIEKGYVKAGKRLGVDPEIIREKVATRLDALDKLPTQELRQRAIVGIGREYPELASPLMRAYRNINHLSNQIIRNMLEANPDPTEGDLKVMTTIANNAFKYTTRMYAIFQGPEGAKFARQMRADHRKAKKLMEKGKDVPAHIKENHDRWENAMTYVIDHDIVIPDDETLDRSSLVRLRGMYDMWFYGKAERQYQHAYEAAKQQGMSNAEAERAGHAYLAAELARLRDDGLDQEVIRKKADDMIAGMVGLGDSSNPLVKYYRGFKEDRSILERREKLPPEIRELFGEIKDPATRLAITLAKQGELVSRARFFLDLRKYGDGQYVIPKNEVGKKGTEKFTAELKGESFGALDGWRTTPAIKKAIDDQMELYTSTMDALTTSFWNPDAYANAVARGAVKGVLKVAQWNKITTVVMDAFNGFLNASGSPVVLAANGMLNPASIKNWKAIGHGLKNGWRAVADTIWATDGTLTKDFEDLIRYELLDSARAQEIRSTPYDHVKKLISQEKSNTARGADSIKRGLGATKRFGIEAYSMLDAWVKITAFRREVDYLEDFYNKAGIKKNSGEIKAEAADRIKDTTIGFSRTPGIVRAAERVGAVTFLPYFVSVYRSLGMNAVVGMKDMMKAADTSLPMEARWAAASHGTSRIVGTAVATYGFTAILKGIAAAATDDDDEDKNEKIKQLMYTDARYADSIPVGTDENGNPVFMRLSRIDPYGPANDVMRIAMNDKLDPETKHKGMLDTFTGLVFSNRAILNLGKMVVNAFPKVEMKDKETKLERIAPATTTVLKTAIDSLPGLDYSDANSVTEFLDSFTPGQFDWFDPTKPTVAKETKAKYVPGKELGALVNGLGGRLDVADPGFASYTALKDLADARKEGREVMNDAQLNLSNTASMQLFWAKVDAEYSAIQRVQEVYEGLTEGMGMSPEKAIKTMKDSAVAGAMTKQDWAMIRRGDIPSTVQEWASTGSRLLVLKSLENNQKLNDKRNPDKKEEADRLRRAWLQAFKAEGINTEK